MESRNSSSTLAWNYGSDTGKKITTRQLRLLLITLTISSYPSPPNGECYTYLWALFLKEREGDCHLHLSRMPGRSAPTSFTRSPQSFSAKVCWTNGCFAAKKEERGSSREDGCQVSNLGTNTHFNERKVSYTSQFHKVTKPIAHKHELRISEQEESHTQVLKVV